MSALYYAIKDEVGGNQTIAIWEGDRAQWQATSKMQSTRSLFRQVHQDMFPHQVDELIKWHYSMGTTLIKQRWCDRPLGQKPDPKARAPRPPSRGVSTHCPIKNPVCKPGVHEILILQHP